MAETARLEIVQIPAGPIETNLFLVLEKATGKTMIVDAPPDSLDAAAREIEARKLSPELLVITHGHWDHIGDADALREHFTVPMLVHAADRHKLENPSYGDIQGFAPDRIIAASDVLELGEVAFEVLHTPGHSPGQVSLYSAREKVMLGGDTLFPGGYGTIEIADASAEETVKTIRRLLELPDDVTVYPGHGLPTTIGAERPWMQRVAETGRLL
jgi:glyoxylase-like metal-dependent hydrolase (beta-lactamase superfamily II)